MLRFGVDDSTLVVQPAGVVEHVEVEPAVVRLEPGAPDHHAGSAGPTTFDHRQPVAHPDHPGEPVHACALQLTGPDAAERLSASTQSPLRQRSADPAEALHERIGPGPQAGDMTDVSAGQEHLLIGGGRRGQVQGDLRPGVPGPHDQDGALRQLGGPAVGAGVELDDAAVEVAGESGTDGAPWAPVARTTLRARHCWSPLVTVSASPSRCTAWTRVLSATGRPKWRA